MPTICQDMLQMQKTKPLWKSMQKPKQTDPMDYKYEGLFMKTWQDNEDMEMAAQ